MGELHGMWHVREEATVIALDLPLVLSGESQPGCVWASVCEAMPVTCSLREGTGEELGLTSRQQQSPSQKRWRDWLFQKRTRTAAARSQTKAAARDWATKCLRVKHGLDRNRPQAAASKGLWVNPLEVKNLTDFFSPASLLSLNECDIFLQWVGGRWGRGEDGGQDSLL